MPNFKLEEMMEIGSANGEKLVSAGIADSDALLTNARTPDQRSALAASTGLPESQLLKFANLVDRYRIHGVGPEFAELLEAAGVETVSELAQRNPETLAKKMAKLNQERDITRHAPLESQVTRWVEQAKILPRMIE